MEFGIQPDFPKAFTYYQQALDSNVALGGVRIGYMIMNGEIASNSKSDAYEYFKRASDMGDPIASLALGRFFHSGATEMPEGVERNLTEALRVLVFAGDQGYSEGYFQAALIFQFQLDNKPMAKELYLLAIRTGHVFSAYEYGRMLFYSLEDSCHEALFYLKLVLRNSDWPRYYAFDSQQAFQKWFKTPYAALATYNLARVMLWQSEAAMNSAFLLEDLFGSHGKEEALEIYKQVSLEDETPEAFRRCGDLDEPMAFEYYSRASELGDLEATFNLATFYAMGKEGHVERNLSRALLLFEAADSGDSFNPAFISKWFFWVKSFIL